MTSWFRMRALAVGLALVAGLPLGAPSVRAATLTGDTINGTMNFCGFNPSDSNHFTPTSGTAPLAFVYDEGPGGAGADTATFTATGLTVEANISSFACGWGMSFTDSTTPFPKLELASSSFGTSFSYQLNGDAIELTWTGTSGWQDAVINPGDFIAVFNIDGELPEPASLTLFAVGLAGIGMIRRRRRAAPGATA